MAWQFDRPDLKEGLVQVFRRADNDTEAISLKPRGLRSDARYEVRNLETGAASLHSGRELMVEGLLVALRAKPAAATIVYTEANR